MPIHDCVPFYHDETMKQRNMNKKQNHCRAQSELELSKFHNIHEIERLVRKGAVAWDSTSCSFKWKLIPSMGSFIAPLHSLFCFRRTQTLLYFPNTFHRPPFWFRAFISSSFISCSPVKKNLTQLFRVRLFNGQKTAPCWWARIRGWGTCTVACNNPPGHTFEPPREVHVLIMQHVSKLYKLSYHTSSLHLTPLWNYDCMWIIQMDGCPLHDIL